MGNFYLFRFKNCKTKFEMASVRAREKEEKHVEKGEGAQKKVREVGGSGKEMKEKR